MTGFRKNFFVLCSLSALILLCLHLVSIGRYNVPSDIFYLLMYKKTVELPFSFDEKSTKEALSRDATLNAANGTPILILDWTRFFHWTISDWRDLKECPELNCKLVTDRTLLNDSAAVVFHLRDTKWNTLPEVRHLWQYYVFLHYESPQTTRLSLSQFQTSFFNLTFTYRYDSDVPSAYGYIRQRSVPNPKFEDISSIARNKTKLVAWFVSQCNVPSRRMDIVKILQRYIPVDIYGACGPLKCGMNCSELLKDKYKFYLSFENSLCKDYVTEKFVDRMNNFVVPIVLERRNYPETVAPNGSFIAVDDFRTIKDMADYLQFLDNNPTEYEKYFNWHKTHVTSKCPNEKGGCGMCDLCRLLHNYTRNGEIKVIHDVAQWWTKDACHYWPEKRLAELTAP